MSRACDADALYERACELEAQALAYVGKIANDETKIEEWRIWSAILAERTAFKHDIFDAPEVKPEPHWVPCSERLPEDEYVLISKKPTKISGDKWCVAIAIRTADPRSRKIQWRDSGFGVIQDDKVLAWMPLPDPYREGEG